MSPDALNPIKPTAKTTEGIMSSRSQTPAPVSNRNGKNFKKMVKNTKETENDPDIDDEALVIGEDDEGSTIYDLSSGKNSSTLLESTKAFLPKLKLGAENTQTKFSNVLGKEGDEASLIAEAGAFTIPEETVNTAQPAVKTAPPVVPKTTDEVVPDEQPVPVITPKPTEKTPVPPKVDLTQPAVTKTTNAMPQEDLKDQRAPTQMPKATAKPMPNDNLSQPAAPKTMVSVVPEEAPAPLMPPKPLVKTATSDNSPLAEAPTTSLPQENTTLSDKPVPVVNKQPEVSSPLTQEAGKMAIGAKGMSKKGVESGVVVNSDLTSEEAEIGKTKPRLRTNFSEERSDLSGYNPNAQQVVMNPDKVEINETTAPKTTMRDLAAKIIETIQTLRSDAEGRTDTIVTLRYPPILEGSTMTLTAMDGAKRDFGIAFAGLSEQGKVFLDIKLKEDQLQQMLSQKGITLNTVTTTTLSEAHTSSDNRGDRQYAREEQQERRQRQPRDEEES